MDNIILVAFYFKPFPGVGSFRLSYWYDRLVQDGYNVKVLTSTPDNQSDSNPDIIRIPINERPILDSVIKDKSLTWGMKCKNILKQLLDSNTSSTVIITGGPFLHIRTLISLKRNYPASQWIIDYRDPLANNPYNNSKGIKSYIKQTIKRIYERTINCAADQIITVNDACQRLTVSGNNKTFIIDNGFDERYFVIRKRNQIQKNSIIYSGKLNNNRNLDHLIAAVRNLSTYVLHYSGPSEVKSRDSVINHGMLSYKDNVALLERSEIGVILTSGEPFESTTKVFDYFAAKLKIIIIYTKCSENSALKSITEGNPNVEWCPNNPAEISDAINRLNRPYVEWDYSRFSRDYGYKTLLKRILK